MIAAWRDYRPDLPRILLLAANLLPLFGVVFAHWDVGSIVLLYWTENIVIGVITVLKMLVTAQLKALPNILFFCLHYGLFCAVHGAFVLELTGFSLITGSPAASGSGITVIATARHILQSVPAVFLWGVLALLLSHGISFLLLFIGQGEFRHATISQLMRAPYRRILVLHVAIIAGAFLVRALGSPVGLLLALVALKIVMDIMLHIRSHREAGTEQPAAAVPAR